VLRMRLWYGKRKFKHYFPRSCEGVDRFLEPAQPRQRLCKQKTEACTVASTLTSDRYFKPTEVSMVSLQDGCLEHPNPADLAVWESRRIWPHIAKPDVVLSLGNGTNAATKSLKTDIFQLIFQRTLSGFLPRLYRTFKSRIDPEKAWAKLLNGLDDKARQDYIRWNITYPGAEPAIDDVDRMDELSHCVETQAHGARVFRGFSALLISSLFFELDGMPPEDEHGVYHCKGSIRCRSGSLWLIRAMTRVHEGVMEFCKDGNSLGCKLDEIDICAACCRYRRPVEFLVRSRADEISLSVKGGKCKGRNLSAMPNSLAWFIKRQNLESPFGCATHDDPGALRCPACSPKPKPRPHNRRATSAKRKRPNPALPPTPRNVRRCQQM
jgi:hypothetical protein